MYKKAAKGWMKHFDFMILDLFCLEISYVMASYWRNGLQELWERIIYREMFVVLLLTDIVMIGSFGSLKNVLKRGYYKEWGATLKHTLMVILLSTFYLFITKSGAEYSRIVLVLTFFIYFSMTFAVRLIWKKYLLSKNVLERGNRSLLIVTTADALKRTIDEFEKSNYGRFIVAGGVAVDEDMTGACVGNVPIVGNRDSVVEYVCREWIDEVFIKVPEDGLLGKELVEQFAEMGVTVHLNLLKIGEHTGQKQILERIGPYMVLTTSINMTTPGVSFVKRMLDIFGGIVGCILTGGLFLIFAPSIYITSPGPIFFSQIRVGQNGKRFKLYKFRSMYLDAEERKKELMENNRVNDGLMFKLDYDPRIIGNEKGQGKGIGNFIRKYSIDEFPQFWNVLKGDMSLVGTRPPTVDEWEKYAVHHRARLAIKPGITGLWQVSGRSGITDFEEVVKLDTQYIREWSFKQDMKILVKTILVVLGQDGAM